jgi:hypothetical protein
VGGEEYEILKKPDMGLYGRYSKNAQVERIKLEILTFHLLQ